MHIMKFGSVCLGSSVFFNSLASNVARRNMLSGLGQMDSGFFIRTYKTRRLCVKVVVAVAARAAVGVDVAAGVAGGVGSGVTVASAAGVPVGKARVWRGV